MATYLITGANRGIGLEYCRQLQQRGEQVIAVCRSISDDLKNLDIQIEDNIEDCQLFEWFNGDVDTFIAKKMEPILSSGYKSKHIKA